MYKAVLGKEWIKTRWFVIGICLASILLHAYMFIKLGRSMRLAGMVHLWDVIINRDQFIFREIRYLPILSGIVLGVAQFVPEIYQKRLKLALHLPLKSLRIISWNISYGLICLMTVFVFSCIVLLSYMSIYFSSEFIISAFYTILPWYLAGLSTYFLVAWICLEPRWDRRIISTLISLPLINMYMLGKLPAAYYSSVYIIVLTLLSIVLVYQSVVRFKDGK